LELAKSCQFKRTKPPSFRLPGSKDNLGGRNQRRRLVRAVEGTYEGDASDGRTTALWYIGRMGATDAIERINQLLDSDMTETSNTSMRIPTALREAAALAAKELRVAPSATALTTMALRATLEAAVMQAALDDHYAQYPEARPDLADIAIAAAEIDGNPLAADPGRIRRAAAEIAMTHPDPEPEDVLLWAEARAFPS
jgi:hypothetical protein